MARGARTITMVGGVRVGHASAEAPGPTGVTVLCFDRAAATVIDVRGGAAATYDTASLALEATFGRRWALFFTGGSLFGLDAGGGVREEVLAGGGGHSAFGHPRRVAPVSGAALFDLPFAPGPLPDYRALGRSATADASSAAVPQGRVGAARGATVGKYLGRDRASPGGLGSAAALEPGLGHVGVLAVVNSVGAIRDPETGRWVAGARGPRGRIRPPRRFRRRAPGPPTVSAGTNLTAVVTDAAVTRPELARIAFLVQAGVARCVVPAQTATDGDVVFASSTSPRHPGREARPGERADRLGARAAELVVQAILRAVAAD
jgi:L-aminopeptidase/D-esterase-like protein